MPRARLAADGSAAAVGRRPPGAPRLAHGAGLALSLTLIFALRPCHLKMSETLGIARMQDRSQLAAMLASELVLAALLAGAALWVRRRRRTQYLLDFYCFSPPER